VGYDGLRGTAVRPLNAELAALASAIRMLPQGELFFDSIVNRLVELVSNYMDTMSKGGGRNPFACKK